jgi:hypothetical protein
MELSKLLVVVLYGCETWSLILREEHRLSWNISVGTATGYGLDDRCSIPGWGWEIFLFDTVSGPALGPTQPPIQWVPGSFSLGIKRPGREADHSPPSSAEDKECVELYLLSPVRFHDMVLS